MPEEDPNPKMKKPLYKRIWFWLLRVFLLYMFAGAVANDDSSDDDSAQSSTSSLVAKSSSKSNSISSSSSEEASSDSSTSSSTDSENSDDDETDNDNDNYDDNEYSDDDAETENDTSNNGDIVTGQQGVIVGNSRTKVYHTPGQQGYRMNSANAVYFNSEAEAQAAGYRKSLR